MRGKYLRTEETCRKMSESHKGQTAWNRGKKASPEHCKANGLGHLGQTSWSKGLTKETNESLKRMSDTMKIKWLDPEIRKMYVESLNTLEAKKNCSEASKRTWLHPEIRKRRIETTKKGINTPEAKKNRSNSAKIYKYEGFRFEFDLKIRKAVFDILGDRCIKCDRCLRDKVLQPHHIDSLIKRFGVLSTEAIRYSEKEIEEEIKKCVLLCESCHPKIHKQAYYYVVKINKCREYIDWFIESHKPDICESYIKVGVAKHHIDSDQDNESKENLLFLMRGDHVKLHFYAYDYLVQINRHREYIDWFLKEK